MRALRSRVDELAADPAGPLSIVQGTRLRPARPTLPAYEGLTRRCLPFRRPEELPRRDCHSVAIVRGFRVRVMPAERRARAIAEAAAALLLAATQALPLLRGDDPEIERVRTNLREAIERVSQALAAANAAGLVPGCR